MKLSLLVALFAFVFLGAVRSAPAELQIYDATIGPHSSRVCDDTYANHGCEGIHTLFELWEIPIGGVDAETGREIIGYEIICDDEVILADGAMNTDEHDRRDINRVFGKIRLHYAPSAPPPPPPK